MRIFRSGNASPQNPPQAVGVEVPKPKSTHRIRELLSFRRLSKQKPLQADSGDTIVVPSSFCSSLAPGTSRQVEERPVSAAHGTPSNSASPFSQPSELTAIPDAVQVFRPPRPVTPPSTHRVSPSPNADSAPGQGQDLLVVPLPPSATDSQFSLPSQLPTIPARQRSPHPRDGNSYQLQAGQDIRMIQESRNVYVDGNNSNVSYTNNFVNNSIKFMAELLQETILGAAFDSSARDPPPRCHPGTRLAILERCLTFIATAADKRKMLWVVGQAGVGKSAIMQNVAESPLPSVSERASIFLSINGRNDGAKAVMTLVYQLAEQCKPYRQFVEHEITHYPSLLQSSMSVQFKKLLIKPFIDAPLSNSISRILIIIDGLDECDKPETQRELLRLIIDMCSSHSSSPFVWIVASRPEHHITSFFARPDVQDIYVKEEIQVDSDEARSDVERFLRAELARIQEEFGVSPGSQWPREQEFWKLASASGGLFVYAQTVTKYIGSLAIGDPISQLDDVLKVIDALPLSDVPREQHPLILLDALYARILSNVPKRVMINTRKILLALVLDSERHSKARNGGFLVLCNWLGMTYDEAYTAIRHLGSVLDAPRRNNAHKQELRSFHKSFIDYISDFTRSGFSPDIKHEAHQLEVQYAIRVLEQDPGGIDCHDMNRFFYFSSGFAWAQVVWVHGAESNIVVTWSADQDNSWSDKTTKLELYKRARSNVVEGIRTRQSVLCNASYIRAAITQSTGYDLSYFPWRELIHVVFVNFFFYPPHAHDAETIYQDKSRRHELTKNGLLTRVSMKQLDFTTIKGYITLRFWRPSGTTTNLSDMWNPSCKHKRIGDWVEGKDADWKTEFSSKHSSPICQFCSQRLERQLEFWKTRSSEHNITILLTSAEISFIEFHFTDPDDGVSEWTYWIMLGIPEEERRKPGNVA